MPSVPQVSSFTFVIAFLILRGDEGNQSFQNSSQRSKVIFLLTTHLFGLNKCVRRSVNRDTAAFLQHHRKNSLNLEHKAVVDEKKLLGPQGLAFGSRCGCFILCTEKIPLGAGKVRGRFGML